MWFKYFILIVHDDFFKIETCSNVEYRSLNSAVPYRRVLFLRKHCNRTGGPRISLVF